MFYLLICHEWGTTSIFVEIMLEFFIKYVIYDLTDLICFKEINIQIYWTVFSN